MMFSTYVTTVSPTYAQEICTPEFGYRYDGILRQLRSKLTGILNGIDLEIWNPETDTNLAANYTATSNRIGAKRVNKRDLLKQVGLPESDAPLLGFIGRLVSQKGVDLIAAMLPQLFEGTEACMVMLGSGDRVYETRLAELVEAYPQRLHVHIGYSEPLAHKIEAGCDMFLMPSRFEPCGLNQMYSLRYGTPPIVNQTGGLADTVVNTTLKTLRNKTANGFVFQSANEETLLSATRSALELYANHRLWQQVCRTAMQMELSWDASAKEYQKLYRSEVKAV
jgi:starch synthase